MEYVRLSQIDKHKLELNSRVYVKALVRNGVFKRTKGDKDYLVIDIADMKCNESIIIWDTAPPIEKVVDVGYVYNFELLVGEYKGEKQFKWLGMSRNLQEDYTQYVARVENVDFYIESIENAFKTLDLNSPVAKITHTLYRRYENEFRIFPAAKSLHHNLIGGLAMHTACILKSVARLYQVYTWLDWELLACIAILHDIGKIFEYKIDTSTGDIGFTPDGSLKGHICMGVVEIEILARELGVSDDIKVLALINGVASHHGKLEYGSPVIPYTSEAKMVHAMDSLDGILYRDLSIYENIEKGEVGVQYLPSGEMTGLFRF